MTKMTKVQYKCSCMQDEGSFEMPSRKLNEDIVDFMKRMTLWLSEDHSLRSPFCRATNTEYVKMLVPEDRPIGSSIRDSN